MNHYAFYTLISSINFVNEYCLVHSNIEKKKKEKDMLTETIAATVNV